MSDIAEFGIVVDPRGAVSGSAKARQAIRSVGTEATQTETRVKKSFRGVATAIKAGVVGFGVTAAIKSSIREMSTYEDALIGVEKTTGLTGAALAKFETRINSLEGQLPATAQEMLNLAQAAGQLGVSGEENLSKVVDVMVRLKESSDVAGEAGAKALARILNISGEGIDVIDQAAASLVALGNSAAASEGEILDMATRVSQATGLFKIASKDAFGLSTAMKELGIRSEAGGTAVGRVFAKINESIQEGGEALEALSEATNVVQEDLVDAFNTDPVDAFLLSMQGLASEGQNAGIALKEIGLSGTEVQAVIGTLASNYDTLKLRVDQSNKAFEDNKALVDESNKAFSSYSSQMKITLNTVKQVQREIGQELAPVLLDLAKTTKGVIQAFRGTLDPLDENSEKYKELANDIVTLGAVMAGLKIGSMVLQLHSAVSALKLATGATTALTAAMRVTPWGIVATLAGAATAAIIKHKIQVKEAKEEYEDFRTKLQQVKKDSADLILSNESTTKSIQDQLKVIRENARTVSHRNRDLKEAIALQREYATGSRTGEVSTSSRVYDDIIQKQKELAEGERDISQLRFAYEKLTAAVGKVSLIEAANEMKVTSENVEEANAQLAELDMLLNALGGTAPRVSSAMELLQSKIEAVNKQKLFDEQAPAREAAKLAKEYTEELKEMGDALIADQIEIQKYADLMSLLEEEMNSNGDASGKLSLQWQRASEKVRELQIAMDPTTQQYREQLDAALQMGSGQETLTYRIEETRKALELLVNTQTIGKDGVSNYANEIFNLTTKLENLTSQLNDEDFRRSLSIMSEEQAKQEIENYEMLRKHANLTERRIFNNRIDMLNKIIPTRAEKIQMMKDQDASYVEFAKQGFKDIWETHETMGDRLIKVSQTTARSIQNNLGRALGNIVTRSQSAKEAFRNMAASIVNDLARIAVQQLIVNQITGAIGTAIGGNTSKATTSVLTQHTGGVIGSGEGGRKSVSPSVFAGAPRYHNGGLAGDEVPAILQKGEAIFTPAQLKALPKAMGMGGGNTNIQTEVNIYSDGRSTSNSSGSSEGGLDDSDTMKRIGELISSSVHTIILQEKRVGGLLA